MASTVSTLSLPAPKNTVTGPTLRPRSPSAPKPGYVVQSPDSRLSVHCPASNSSDNYLPNRGSSTYDPPQTHGDSDSDESVVEITRAEDLLAPIPKKKKKADAVKPKPATRRANCKGRPRDSGASASTARGPAKKVKKSVAGPVSHFSTLFIWLDDFFSP